MITERIGSPLEETAHLMPTYGAPAVTFVRGSGTSLWDTEGKEYLDLLSGISVCSLGHCDPTVDRFDWYVGVRAGRVECLWPVAARGGSA